MSVAKFYDLEARKISADGESVALFTKHPGTLGAFREARLRTYLRDHVGASYALASGFVVDHDSGSCRISDRSSRQVDCLIYEPTIRAPLIAVDSFSAVLPPQVAGVIEVKSNLTFFRSRAKSTESGDAYPHRDAEGAYRWAGTLVDALENIMSATDVMREAKIKRTTYFSGIFAYSSNGLAKLPQALESGELIRQLDIDDIDALPDDICALDAGWLGFSAYRWNDISPEWDEIYDPEVSYLLSISEDEGSNGGVGLQLFTSALAHILEGRGGAEHLTGGLRSFVGREFDVENVAIDLPCLSRTDKASTEEQ